MTLTPLMSLLGFFALTGLLLTIIFYKWRLSNAKLNQEIRSLKKELDNKSIELGRMTEELRISHLKLFESGRVSALANFSAGILHQISQPATAIHGFIKFIKKEMDPQYTFYRPVCLIEEQSVYMKKMLDDLMDVVRHREVKKENINVNDAIKKATNLLTDELRIRRINWDLALGEKLPNVYADSIQLQQIFMNIITNAMQALSIMPRGAERYLKITSQFNLNDNHIHISFKDSGPGIALGDETRVFEPFFSTKEKGTGIGLALCQNLIADHEGTISVESELNKGANFIIRIPVVSAS